jgi:hydrogenase maturation protein HypF
VATSGNRSEEPIAIDNREAEERLSGIADVFLVHDRPITRPVDDSIVRVMAGRAMILRRARGYAPLPIRLGRSIGPALAVGAHMKGAVAVSSGSDATVSQHLGNLGSEPSLDRFQRTIRDLCGFPSLRPARVACDLHPDYPSTRFAEAFGSETGAEVVRVQHHHAHVLACMAENELDPPVLGVAWDGTGYGPDGTVWGGEFLRVTAAGFERVAHLRRFRLPGGEKAIVEPRRAALGLLFEIFGEDLPADLAPVRAFRPSDRAVLLAMLRKGVHAPLTSSAGRLFDAMAALLDLHPCSSYEGQAAMALEHAIDGYETEDRYGGRLEVSADGGGRRDPGDWEPIVRGIIADLRRGAPPGRIAARVHNSLVEAIVSIALIAGEKQVVLTGGCFQNRYLTERTVRRLREAGFQPCWHQRVPPNDGGIALGQLAALARM